MRCPKPGGPHAGLRSKIGLPRCNPAPASWGRWTEQWMLCRPAAGRFAASPCGAPAAQRARGLVHAAPERPWTAAAMAGTEARRSAAGAGACDYGSSRSQQVQDGRGRRRRLGDRGSRGGGRLGGWASFSRRGAALRAQPGPRAASPPLPRVAARPQRPCARGNRAGGSLGDHGACGRARGDGWSSGGGAIMGGAERGCGTICAVPGAAGAAAAGGAGGSGRCSRRVRSVARQACGGLLPALPASPAHERGAPLLPLLASWPEWPSSHRRVWRCARDRSSGRWSARRARGAQRSHASRDCASCAKCARTFSASSASSELECVLPPATPSSGRMSRIARDLTSSSFARSLIRTLLIRLFSIQCAAKPPLVAHSYLMALAAL